MRRRWLPRVLTLAVCWLAACAIGRASQDGLAPRPLLEGIAERLGRDDLDGAATQVAAALDAYPRDPLLHNLAGVVFARRDDMTRAAGHFERAVDLDPQAVAAHENLARLYQQHAVGDGEMRRRALAAWERLLAVAPEHLEATWQSAVLSAQTGSFDRCLSQIARLPAATRQQARVVALQAAALASVGKTAEAEAAAAQIGTRADLVEDDVLAVLPLLESAHGHTAALAMLQALDRAGGTTPRSLRALAATLLEAGRPGEARVAFERVASAEGPSADLLMTLARTALLSDDRDGALGYLAHARALAPDNPQVHFFFGLVCVRYDLVREAYDSLKRAVELAPDDPHINYAMGAVATHRHEPSESLPYFERYVALRPDDPRGTFALGTALFYAKLFDRARDTLTRAARSEATATGAHLFLGRIARQTNDLDTAHAELRLALARDPSLADAWAELGLVQLRMGHEDDARVSLDRAVALVPDHYEAALNLATLYARTNDPRREAQAARVARLLDARDARARDFLKIINVVPPDPSPAAR